jgi:hypothetical protein
MLLHAKLTFCPKAAFCKHQWLLDSVFSSNALQLGSTTMGNTNDNKRLFQDRNMYTYLIFNNVLQTFMEMNDLGLITKFMSQMEEKPVL